MASIETVPVTHARRFGRLPLPPGVFAVAGAVVLVLLALADRYGFQPDELYFVLAGRHPDFGYVDQPPLDPLLSAAAVQLFGLSPLSVRILPALAAGACVLLTAAIAAAFGASRRGQLLAALLLAGSGILGLGHVGVTATYDVLGWTVVLWLLARLLARPGAPSADDRWTWVGVGVAAGLALQNKAMPLSLAATFGVGLVLARRWDVIRSRWTWLAVGIAFLIWLPNLAWQASHGFPQLTMAGSIAGQSDGSPMSVLLALFLLSGPLVALVSLVGVAWLLLSAEARRWRPLGWVFVLHLGVLLALRGRDYYAGGIMPLAVAAGAVPLERWLARRWPRLRLTAFGAALACSTATVAVVSLPLLPAATLWDSPIRTLVPASTLQLGWPELVTAVRAAVNDLDPDERVAPVILTRDYAEASALSLLGDGLPPVYSAHNSMADWGPPAASTAVILVDLGAGPRGADFVDCRGWYWPGEYADDLSYHFLSYWGNTIEICRGPALPWAEQWPTLRHVDNS